MHLLPPPQKKYGLVKNCNHSPHSHFAVNKNATFCSVSLFYKFNTFVEVFAKV